MSRIVLQKLILQGITYRRSIKFNAGFNIISGEKTSGKSLILSLIDYCFGKSSKIDLNVQKELDAHCDEVFLEISIDKEILTLNRSLKDKFDKINTYFCPFDLLDTYTPKILDVKGTLQMLMQKLSINEYKLIRYKQHSTEKEIDTVSFRDIFRYAYIHQHALGTGDFLERKDSFKRNKNPHAFKMMFNLVDIDKDTLNEQLVEVQNKITQTKREIMGLSSYLRDRDAEDRLKLQFLIEKCKTEIENQKQEKNKIIDDSKSNENNENKLYIKLKKDIENISNEIYDYRSRKKLLNLSVNSKNLLLEEYRVELLEIEETLNINYRLVVYDQSLECPLCNSKITTHNHVEENKNVDTEKILQKVKKELVSKISLVSGLVETDIRKIEKLDKEIENLLQKQSIFSEAISAFSKKTDVPFLSQIDSINIMINRLTKNHEIYKESLRIHHKIDEKEKYIDGLNIDEARLKKNIAALQISDVERQKILDFLDIEYKKYMRRLKYNTSDGTYIHKDTYIPFYNGASVYAHESGGLLESMQLSYLGAILKSKTEGFATGHPGFLLLDSISKYVGTLKKQESQGVDLDLSKSKIDVKELNDDVTENKNKINDPEVYEEFYRILIELSKDHQVILVENTPPDEFDELYTQYTFYNGDHGLIDDEANEFKD